jgi:hypothetical protein
VKLEVLQILGPGPAGAPAGGQGPCAHLARDCRGQPEWRELERAGPPGGAGASLRPSLEPSH